MNAAHFTQLQAAASKPADGEHVVPNDPGAPQTAAAAAGRACELAMHRALLLLLAAAVSTVSCQ